MCKGCPIGEPGPEGFPLIPDKYYTPSIEEFHVGFEFERASYGGKLLPGAPINKEWILTKIDDSFDFNDVWDLFNEKKNEQDLRVKYLDEEDIESFGITTDIVNTMIFCKYKNEDLYFDYDTVSHEFKISKLEEDGFVFIIKNKSELKMLLKQLNII